MCLDFNVTANTHSASAIVPTEKENLLFAHVRVKERRTPGVCPSKCLTEMLMIVKQLHNTGLTSRGGKRLISPYYYDTNKAKTYFRNTIVLFLRI